MSFYSVVNIFFFSSTLLPSHPPSDQSLNSPPLPLFPHLPPSPSPCFPPFVLPCPPHFFSFLSIPLLPLKFFNIFCVFHNIHLCIICLHHSHKNVRLYNLLTAVWDKERRETFTGMWTFQLCLTPPPLVSSGLGGELRRRRVPPPAELPFAEPQGPGHLSGPDRRPRAGPPPWHRPPQEAHHPALWPHRQGRPPHAGLWSQRSGPRPGPEPGRPRWVNKGEEKGRGRWGLRRTHLESWNV